MPEKERESCSVMQPLRQKGLSVSAKRSPPPISEHLVRTFRWSNVYYDPDTVSIIICYEILSELIELDALKQ